MVVVGCGYIVGDGRAGGCSCGWSWPWSGWRWMDCGVHNLATSQLLLRAKCFAERKVVICSLQLDLLSAKNLRYTKSLPTKISERGPCMKSLVTTSQLLLRAKCFAERKSGICSLSLPSTISERGPCMKSLMTTSKLLLRANRSAERKSGICSLQLDLLSAKKS